eukprot:257187_1
MFANMTAFLVSLHYLFALTISKTNNFDFSVDPTDIIRKIDYPFYGFTFDFWKNNDSNGKWFPNASILVLDLSNPDLIALTKAISPAILRIGGTPQDSIIFNISGECNENYGLPKYNCSKTKFNNTLNTEYYGCINKTRWKQINEFGLATNVTVIYGLNACYGRKSHTSPMNMSNVENLIDFTNSLGDTSIFGFEYGNEIDSHIDVNVYSSDFFKLYQMMKGKYKMLGTDNGLGSFVDEFMANLQNISVDLNAADILYRLTYHHYANCAYPASDTVFSLSCLNSSSKEATECYEQASPYNITCAMGEGSEHSGGGTPNVSNTFVDNFYYLNQLCSVLTAGDGNTMRSDLSGGNYELIDHMTVLPNPDYWILYIWKQLIGDALYKSNIKPFSGNVRG